MAQDDDVENELLRSVALKNASAILLARHRVEQELLAAKEALRLTTERLTGIVESITDGFYVLDAEWRFTYVNQRAADVIGPVAGPHDGLIGTCLWDLCPHLVGTEVEANYRRAMTERVTVEFESFYAPLSSWLAIRAYPGRDGLSVFFQDITERKNAAEERAHLLESERAARTEAEHASAMKDEFLATLSHELRTPLSAILGWSQVLRLGTRSEADLRQGLETIERNARIQTQLIEDLLDMSSITSGKLRLDIQPLEPASFVAAAIETVRPAAEAKGVRLEKLLDPAAGPVSGDARRLQQVVWNLLSNAIKFTPKGGKVQVLLERVTSHVELSVSDTGIGIRPEFLPHVFERFRQGDASTTRTFGGLGLGLSIVKQLVELHGGTVRVSSPGEHQGATFSVALPLKAVHGSAQPGRRPHPTIFSGASAPFEHSDLSGVKVLVVDDDLDARALIRRVLGECNAEVLTAATAKEALELVGSERPDVLVSDIGMPETDGYELLKKMRALGGAGGGRIPAIALTAFARSEDRTRALRAGFLVHVAKPVEPSELIATVASVAGRTGWVPGDR